MTDATPDAAPLAQVIADLARRNEELAGSVGHWQARAVAAEERLKALEEGTAVPNAPQDANAVPLRGDAPETTQGPLRPASEPQAPVWRRWWRRVRGGD